jgi:hypothetical protein
MRKYIDKFSLNILNLIFFAFSDLHRWRQDGFFISGEKRNKIVLHYRVKRDRKDRW